MSKNRIFEWFGGRKAAAGFYASALLTLMAKPLGADFQTYGTMLLVALGLTVTGIATEDIARSRRAQ